ncbi:MAG: SDR family oxidoreductase [Pseudomonadota bacterium]
MTSLQGKTIVVGGGTGDVGAGIVEVLAGAGARVVVPVRSAERRKALMDASGNPERLTFVEAAPTNPDSAARLRAALSEIGQIDGAVASLGSWFQLGRVVDTPAEGFRAAWESLLQSHFLFARAVLPAIAPGGSYVMINGAGAEVPVPGASAVSINARGLTMLFEALVAEHPDLHVHMMLLRSLIATRARPNPDPRWVTARNVGEAVAWMFTDLGRLTAGGILPLHARHAFTNARTRP